MSDLGAGISALVQPVLQELAQRFWAVEQSQLQLAFELDRLTSHLGAYSNAVENKNIPLMEKPIEQIEECQQRLLVIKSVLGTCRARLGRITQLLDGKQKTIPIH